MLESWGLSIQFPNFQSLEPRPREKPRGLKPLPYRVSCPHFTAMNSARNVLLGQKPSKDTVLPDQAPLASP